jgi:hypothetical protein
MANNYKCGSELIHDIERLPTGVAAKDAFEAVFLGNVLSHIDGRCLNNQKILIKQQCKTQYPDINSKNWCNWLTAVDQENQISLTHTIERANVPMLYNTPRLCDPGITMSKNWSLRNYIESRLYMFKFVYKFGNGYNQNSNRSSNCGKNNASPSSCYPNTVFDFRPYTYAFRLPGRINSRERRIYVTQHITVGDDDGALGFTPHTSLSTFYYKPVKNTRTSLDVFKSLVKAVITSKDLGSNKKSILNKEYPLGASGSGINNDDRYIEKFITFIRKYDRIKFAGEEGLLSNSSTLQLITLTDNVIRTMFYDLIHDDVVDKTNNFEEFKNKFISEFKDSDFGFPTGEGGGSNKFGRPGIVTYDKLIGKTIAKKSYKTYGSILTPVKGNNGSINFKIETVKRKKKGESVNVNKRIPQYPALFKTLGDLSQFMYAAKYNTIVASGDKMGIAAGMYMNALNRKIVKCMIEDAVTGFIVYTGMNPAHVEFVTKSGCGGLSNKANTCYGKTGLTITVSEFKVGMTKSLSQAGQNQVVDIKNRQKSLLNKELTRLRTNGQLAGANQNRVRTRATNPITRRNALIAKLNKARQNANKIIKTPPNTQPNSSAMNLNNSAKRRNSLNRYITNLNSQLEQHSIPNRLNKTVYMNNLAKSNTDNNLKRIKQKALNNLRLVAVKNGFKKTMRNLPYYSNLTNNNKNMLNGLIKGAPSINKLVTNIGPFINNTAKNRQAQKRGRNNSGSINGNGNVIMTGGNGNGNGNATKRKRSR